MARRLLIIAGMTKNDLKKMQSYSIMSLVDHIDYQNVRTVKSTRFGIMSPEQIIAGSVAHIYNHIGKHKGDDSNTLLDPRLGATRNRVNAITGLSQKFDPGNFGHCILAKPVYHPMFFDYVKRVTDSVCPVCSLLRYKTEDQKKDFLKFAKTHSNYARFVHVTTILSKNKTNCIRCGTPLPNIRDNNSTNVIMGLQATIGKDKEDKADLNPEQVYRILKNISDEDSYILGLDPKTARPDWMMITVLPVPPPSIRPSVQVESGKVSEDDLTHAFNNIIKHNNALRLMLEKKDLSSAAAAAASSGTGAANANVIHKLWQSLQFAVATMIDNETSSYPTATNRTHRPLKTIRKRHRGKQGRIRWNLMGKRVNSSARSVITADPIISINQVGVPQAIAMNLTYPEIVTKYNRDQLNRLVANGPFVYPGAKHYKAKNDRFRKDLAVVKDITLSDGDIVYRHILDGDIVFFNRQPSLHKMSMMAHHAKVMPGYSFRLNPNVTTPYGADFDGDEMNLHVPQSVETAYELQCLTMVSTQIVSPQASKPIIGLVQDSLLGVYRMSSEKVRGLDQISYMNPRQFMKLVVWLNNYIGKIPKPRQYRERADLGGYEFGWTTRQLFNMFFPNISIKVGDFSIKNGVVSEPVDAAHAVAIGKKVVGKSAGGGLFHVTWNDLGPSATRDLLDNFSRLTSQWLLIDGFSVGVSDVEIAPDIMKKIRDLKHRALTEANELIQGLHLGKYDEVRDRIIRQPRGLAPNDYEQFETDIMYHLGRYKGEIETLTVKNLNSLQKDNRVSSMVDSGSKGSSANVVQIISLLGQQEVNGARIKDGYMRRPLPHVPKDDLSPESRGFVANSFIEGLNPLEYIFHAMAGRIGVISTSIKTAETGYIQRKLVKVLEDVYVTYDGTVRNATGIVVQYLYGGDGFDATKIEPQKLDYLSLADDSFMMKYSYTEPDFKDLEIVCSEEALKRFKEEEAEQRDAVREEFMKIQSDREEARRLNKWELPEKIYSPINFNRLIKHTVFTLGLKSHTLSDLTPKDIIEQVNETVESLRVSENKQINEISTSYIKFLMRSKLCSKNLLFNEKFTQDALSYLLTHIKIKFNDALISSGEAVGPIAAQSIGEPSTQMSNGKSTQLIVHTAGLTAKVSIGEFIDGLLVKNSKDVIDLGADSVELRTDDLMVQTVDPTTEKTKWTPVRTVSRHPANGGMVTIKTKSGRKTTTTLSHSHLRRDSEKGIVPVKGSELKVGDRVPVAMKLQTVDKPVTAIKHKTATFYLTPMFGWFLGAYIAEGSINSNKVLITNIKPQYEENIKKFCLEIGASYQTRKYKGEFGPSMAHTITGPLLLADFIGHHCGMGSFNKKLPDFIYGAPIEVITALIRGAFDGDGNISASKGHEQVRYCSRSKQLVDDFAVLLAYAGLFGTIGVQNVKGEPFYWLTVLRKHVKTYMETIGSDVHKDKLADAVKSLEDSKKNSHEYIDCIPCDDRFLHAIANCGFKLGTSGQSRTYGRWLRNGKTKIGRDTLEKYIEDFKDLDPEFEDLKILKRSCEGDVLWDEIVEIEVTEDPKEYVYDLTVPGIETFMVDAGVFVHNTLDTFHHTGIGAKANVSRGVPRLKEIMSLSTKPKTPSIVIYMSKNVFKNMRVTLDSGDITKTVDELDQQLQTIEDKEEAQSFKDMAQKSIIRTIKSIKSRYDHISFGDVVKKVEIIYDESDKETVVEEDQKLLDAYWEICGADEVTQSPWVLRFELDKNTLADHNIQVFQIEHVFNNNPTVSSIARCIFSDDNSETVVCRARVADVGTNPMEILEKLETILMNIKIKGVPNISKTSIRINKSDIMTDNGAIVSQYDSDYKNLAAKTLFSEDYLVDTVGSNLLEILNMPYIDTARTYTNNIHEIFDIYGVEGARQAIINEITEVMEYADASVGNRHIELLADIMTSRGILQSVDRFGVKKGETGPWARASFEETTPHMIKAAAFSEVDNMKGVSANVMFGQFIKIGTNSFSVGLDERLLTTVEEEKEEDDAIGVSLVEADDTVDYCKRERFDFSFSI